MGFVSCGRVLPALALVCIGGKAMALDVNAMWDFSKPATSEQRFRAALAGATPDEATILQTQIARTWGLRREFERAREVLAPLAERIAAAGAEAQVRYWLELGRTYASPAHRPETVTRESREIARGAYLRAFDIAKAGALDALAIDALHMMAMVDTEPAAQLDWGMKAIAYMEASSQPQARQWEGALYNNVGYAQHLAGRYDDAVSYYRKSIAAHERANRAGPARIGHWMVARTLRAQEKFREALAIQLRLEREWDAAGQPDVYVYEELAHLYRALGDDERANHYAAMLAAPS